MQSIKEPKTRTWVPRISLFQGRIKQGLKKCSLTSNTTLAIITRYFFVTFDLSIAHFSPWKFKCIVLNHASGNGENKYFMMALFRDCNRCYFILFLNTLTSIYICYIFIRDQTCYTCDEIQLVFYDYQTLRRPKFVLLLQVCTCNVSVQQLSNFYVSRSKKIINLRHILLLCTRRSFYLTLMFPLV